MNTPKKSQLLPALVLGMVSALLASLLNILLPIPTPDANTAYVIAMIKAAAAFVLAMLAYSKAIAKIRLSSLWLALCAAAVGILTVAVRQLLLQSLLQAGSSLVNSWSTIALLIGLAIAALGAWRVLVKSQPAAGGQNAGGTPAPQPFDQPTQPIPGQGTEALAGQRSPAAGDDDLCEQLLASLRPLLKAPLTAVLCAREELQIQSDGAGGYAIIGYVNSQNSYGAMIRTGFRASAVYRDGRWQVLSIKMENQAAKNLASSYVIGIAVTLLLFAFFYFLFSM